MTESLETIVARIDERQKAQIRLLETQKNMTAELLKIVKGDNSNGLTTRMAVLEQQQGNCPKVQKALSSIKWLTWGVRLIVAAIVGGFLWMIRS